MFGTGWHLGTHVMQNSVATYGISPLPVVLQGYTSYMFAGPTPDTDGGTSLPSVGDAENLCTAVATEQGSAQVCVCLS